MDCVAKAGKDILGDGARIAGNGDKLCMPSLVQEKQIIYAITYRIKISHACSGVGNTGYGSGYGYGYQGVDQGYVTRKELVKSGLLLGAGILKGALLTTVINNINNNNGK